MMDPRFGPNRNIPGGLAKRALFLPALLAVTELAGFTTAFVPFRTTSYRQDLQSSAAKSLLHDHRSAWLASTFSPTSSSLTTAFILRSTTDDASVERVEQQPKPAAVGGGGMAPPFSVTLEGDNYSYQEAIQRTLGWVGAAVVFGGALWSVFGSTAGEEFFAGYLVEQSLSVDNLFVFLVLFEYFKVPVAYQDRVLNWGIYGAVVMRAVMIGVGAAALENFHAILLVFAAILVYSSAKFFLGNDDEAEEDPGQNAIIQISQRLIDSTNNYDGDRFFTLVDGIRKATPLFICMIAIEISDVVFAVDSIPAVFGVTKDPLIVFSSNMFAIMGLRSMYTILSKAATDLKYLEPAVAVVLGFIGSKMIAEYFDVLVPTSIALSVVATTLSVGVGASVWEKQQQLIDNKDTPSA